jgi:hypothetical protein
VDEMSWPTTRNGNVVCQIVLFKMSNLHWCWWEASWFLEMTLNTPLEVCLPGYGWIYKVLSGQNLNKRQCEITIGNFLTCICLDFVTMIFKFVRSMKEMGALSTHVICFIACHVLWVVWKFHSFSNLELWWSSSLVESWCNFYVSRSTLLNCHKKQIQWTLSILAFVMMLRVWLLK